jgi:hypothetical protein
MLCMDMHVFIHLFACMLMYKHIHVCVIFRAPLFTSYIHKYIFVNMYIHIYTYIYSCTFVYVYTYIYIYLYMYIYICIYIYIYILCIYKWHRMNITYMSQHIRYGKKYWSNLENNRITIFVIFLVARLFPFYINTLICIHIKQHITYARIYTHM